MSSKQITQVVVLVAVITVTALGFVLVGSDQRVRADAGGEDGILGGDFTLTSHTGSVSLSDFKDKVVVLYFGFLSCPEVCPASMGMVSTAMNRLDAEEVAQVQPILVSIDPARDTPEQLAEFGHYFHPKLIGLTGTQAEIDAVTADYGAFVEIRDSTTAGSAYEFTHSSRYYVIDKSGELADAMRHGTTANELVARIRTLI